MLVQDATKARVKSFYIILLKTQIFVVDRTLENMFPFHLRKVSNLDVS